MPFPPSSDAILSWILVFPSSPRTFGTSLILPFTWFCPILNIPPWRTLTRTSTKKWILIPLKPPLWTWKPFYKSPILPLFIKRLPSPSLSPRIRRLFSFYVISIFKTSPRIGDISLLSAMPDASPRKTRKFCNTTPPQFWTWPTFPFAWLETLSPVTPTRTLINSFQLKFGKPSFSYISTRMSEWIMSILLLESPSFPCRIRMTPSSKVCPMDIPPFCPRIRPFRPKRPRTYTKIRPSRTSSVSFPILPIPVLLAVETERTFI